MMFVSDDTRGRACPPQEHEHDSGRHQVSGVACAALRLLPAICVLMVVVRLARDLRNGYLQMLW